MLPEALERRLGAFFASDPEALADPWPLFRAVREAGPAHEIGPSVVVTRYADVRGVLRDAARFGSRARSGGSRAEAIRARLADAERDAFDEVRAFEALQVAQSDGEQHERLRRIAGHAFTPARVAELADRAQRTWDELIGPLAGEAADVVPAAYSLPLTVVADLLGIPERDRELVHGWTQRIGRNRGGTEVGPLLDARDAIGEFRRYVEELVAARGETAGDLLSELLAAELTADELAAMVVQLLFAGHETTTNLIAIGLLELLRHPEQWRALCEEPALVTSAVEELLRFTSPAQYGHRVALEDVAVGGVQIRAGTTVIPIQACANRDPEVFLDPDELDLSRPESGLHLAFGFGPHYCLGAALTRLEARIALGTLARRFPRLELAEEPARWEGQAAIRRPAGVVVHFVSS